HRTGSVPSAAPSSTREPTSASFAAAVLDGGGPRAPRVRAGGPRRAGARAPRPSSDVTAPRTRAEDGGYEPIVPAVNALNSSSWTPPSWHFFASSSLEAKKFARPVAVTFSVPDSSMRRTTLPAAASTSRSNLYVPNRVPAPSFTLVPLARHEKVPSPPVTAVEPSLLA